MRSSLVSDMAIVDLSCGRSDSEVLVSDYSFGGKDEADLRRMWLEEERVLEEKEVYWKNESQLAEKTVNW